MEEMLDVGIETKPVFVNSHKNVIFEPIYVFLLVLAVR